MESNAGADALVLLFCVVGACVWSLWAGRRSGKRSRIGRGSGGEACGSPKGARKSGGLDFEVEGMSVEVQKGRENEADWTSRWWGGAWKSKRSEKKLRIGLGGSGEKRGSPKGAREGGGLDFEVEWRGVKVQKVRVSSNANF